MPGLKQSRLALMKRLILTGLASLAMISVAPGRTDPSYVNNLVLVFNPPNAPPMIDATNFVNNVAFIDNTFNRLSVAPFETANTVYYTNFGVLGSLQGFRFDTFNTDTGLYSRAGTLHNGGGAVINCGGTNDGPYFTTNASYFFSIDGPLCLVSATNIINRGTIEMGPNGLLSLEGQNVSLSGGLLNMEGFESGDLFGTAGMFDGYWGLGQTAQFNPAASFGSSSPSAPLHWVTNRDYSYMRMSLSLPRATAYVSPGAYQGPSNYLWQVVFLQNEDSSLSNNVYFGGVSLVEWVWPATNIVTGLVQNNHLLFEDNMMGYPTLELMTNGMAPPNTGYRPTYLPTNYFFFQGGSFYLGTPATPGSSMGIFPNTNIITEYTAYEAIFQPTTVIASELDGQTYSNMPGRIEITAEKQLDLRSSRIAGLNYVRLTATNNYLRDASTRLLTAAADFDLGVTNSTMTVSNLLAPTCPRLDGYVDVFSTRWTNVDSASITNTYFVTLVDSHLASSAPSVVQNLTLRAPTNVVISDVLNVISNITIDTYNLLITTNGPGALARVGELNLPPGALLGTSAFPRLRSLTNDGVISVQNVAFFGSATKSYWDFVNHGRVTTEGCSIWATNFENTGLIDAGPGPINVTATSAVLSNGVLNAPFNDIVLSAGSLLISNQVLNAGHSLTIRATDSLSDGGPNPTNGSFWAAGVLGFNLPIAPPIASLLGTTITNTAPDWASVVCQWAGKDLGAVPTGYSNNAAVGRLVLDGGPNSSYVFTGTTAANALYVDYLEFRNGMSRFDSSGNLAGLAFAPGMKIYYAQLIINGVTWAEKLNGKNGDGLNWVPGYAGAYSSTNLLYPDGTTNRLNLALVQSCNLDSNGNGIPNCQDQAPVFVTSQVALAAALTNATPRAVVLAWNSIPYATNTVLFAPSVTAANWQTLTNFVLGPVGGRQRFVDPIGAGSRVYRVRVDAAGP